ncbi:MAG: hypothetical protein AAFU80_06815 [Pseudomonadota bacterium]
MLTDEHYKELQARAAAYAAPGGAWDRHMLEWVAGGVANMEPPEPIVHWEVLDDGDVIAAEVEEPKPLETVGDFLDQPNGQTTRTEYGSYALTWSEDFEEEARGEFEGNVGLEGVEDDDWDDYHYAICEVFVEHFEAMEARVSALPLPAPQPKHD